MSARGERRSSTPAVVAAGDAASLRERREQRRAEQEALAELQATVKTLVQDHQHTKHCLAEARGSNEMLRSTVVALKDELKTASSRSRAWNGGCISLSIRVC